MTKLPLIVLCAALTGGIRACPDSFQDDDDTPVAVTDATPTGTTGTDPRPITRGSTPTATGGPLTAQVPEKWTAAASALGDAAGASEAVATFVKAGAAACPVLRTVVLQDGDISRRGRAVEALAGVKDVCADDVLLELERVRTLPELVRTWAAAARVQRAPDMEALVALAPLVSQFPALARPVGMRAEALIGPDGSAADLVALSITVPTMNSAILPMLEAKPTPELVAVMLTDKGMDVRRQAASFIATFAAKDPPRAEKIVAAYAFDPKAKVPMWDGGPLYVPGASWNKDQARTLYRHLLSWQIFCEERGLTDQRQQVINNLRSVGIWRVAGYGRYNGDTFAAVREYERVEGRDALMALLKLHGLEKEPRYAGGASQVTR